MLVETDAAADARGSNDQRRRRSPPVAWAHQPGLIYSTRRRRRRRRCSCGLRSRSGRGHDGRCCFWASSRRILNPHSKRTGLVVAWQERGLGFVAWQERGLGFVPRARPCQRPCADLKTPVTCGYLSSLASCSTNRVMLLRVRVMLLRVLVHSQGAAQCERVPGWKGNATRLVTLPVPLLLLRLPPPCFLLSLVRKGKSEGLYGALDALIRF